MQNVIDFLIQPYLESNWTLIILEIIAVVFGIASVLYARKENILVFPTGIISTGIYVYLLFRFQLLGDMIINFYYTIMSIFGWYIWTRVVENNHYTPITRVNSKESYKSLLIFLMSVITILIIYRYKAFINSFFVVENLNQIHQLVIIDYIDAITTGIAFVAMWLMAKKKLENWILWIIADIISVPLYFYKGLGLTGVQYFVFLILAIFGYIEWRKKLNPIRE